MRDNEIKKARTLAKYNPIARRYYKLTRERIFVKRQVEELNSWKFGKIGRKVGKPSYNGMVFRLVDHPSKIVKLTVTTDEMFASEVKGMKAASSHGNPVHLYYSATLPDFYSGLFRKSGTLGVLVMDDFFYGSSEHGDLNDFDKRHPELVEELKSHIQVFARPILSKVKHGDLHPGNILYRKMNGQYQLALIDFGYSYSGNKPPGTKYTNGIGRVSYKNKNVNRVENNWYLNHWYKPRS